MHGKTQTVKHQAVSKRKVNKTAVALDSENNTLSINDIVKTVDGVHSVGLIFNELSLEILLNLIICFKRVVKDKYDIYIDILFMYIRKVTKRTEVFSFATQNILP